MGKPGAHRTILVVDDHAAHRQLLELVLGAHHYQVVSARDGHDALTYLQSTTPDALILDVTMPHMSGFDVARKLRRVARLKHVPILFVTSQTRADTQQQADEVGAAAVIQKPISGTDLDRRLRTIIG